MVCWEDDIDFMLNKSHVLTSPPDFAPEIKLPLSKLTATDNIMLGKHGQ
jgi:hypothetical protein